MPLVPPVFFVSDTPDRSERLARGIAVFMPCRILAVGSAIPAGKPSAWIIDLDVEPLAGSPWFATLLARIEPATPCIFLSRANGSDQPAFYRIPSPIILPARVHTADIVATLQRVVRHTAQESSEARTERQVGEATQLIGTLFEAAATGAAPSPAEADAGTEIVLEAVSDIGIRAWLDLVWRHDISVYQHSLGVAGYAAAFAAELGFSRADRHRLAKAALLHDVGKARIPNAILDKPGPLTPEETEIMRGHAAIGEELLAATGDYERAVLDVVRSHHERLDGSGYPDGLKAGQIGDLVRLISICDVYSALTERRVYRSPLPGAKARAMLDGMAGQLDPDLLRAFRPVMINADPSV